jgi:hypothetical protein
MTDPPHVPGPPSRNGHRATPAGAGAAGVRRCPACGAAGVRYLRSTGRWLRDAVGDIRFAYVTFCAACGHEYPAGADA